MAKRKLSAKQRAVLKANAWKKGQSGNAEGRPRKILPSLDGVLIEFLGGSSVEDPKSGIAQVVKNIFTMAKDPKNVQAIRAASLLIERAYGKDPIVITATSDITSKGEKIGSAIDVSKLDDTTLKNLIKSLHNPESK